jgi:pyrroline-5-carboxylate reductase
MLKLGFIGIGKIAIAAVKGLCTSGMENYIINLSPRNKLNANRLVKAFSNVNKLESNQSVLDNSDFVFISLRIEDAIKELKDLKFRSTHNVISFIPFLKYSKLVKAVNPAKKVSRAIPLPTVVNHNSPIPIFNTTKAITGILSYLGKPLLVKDESQLHTLWALTGFIAPFYDILNNLSDWAIQNSVKETIANQYIVDMFYSLLYHNYQTKNINFSDLMKEATTPNGLNYQAKKEINEKRVQLVYKNTANNLLKRFD